MADAMPTVKYWISIPTTPHNHSDIITLHCEDAKLQTATNRSRRQTSQRLPLPWHQQSMLSTYICTERWTIRKQHLQPHL